MKFLNPLNRLNPAAGDVPVPKDKREVAAALEAGRVTYRIYPYYEWRYGERGRKFTHSDSAWLAWLTQFDQNRVNQEIDWLRGLLANRGMPSSLMETHLRLLCRRLQRTVPAKARRYSMLDSAADRLQRARDERISPHRQRRLVDDFVERLGQGRVRLVTGTAEMIVAAVADEKLGVKEAVGSLEAWLVDVPMLRRLPGLRRRLDSRGRRVLASRAFERAWRAAIEQTIQEARQHRGG